MNGDQRMAVVKSVAANDYALVLGMPGTGKTSTTAFADGHIYTPEVEYYNDLYKMAAVL